MSDFEELYALARNLAQAIRYTRDYVGHEVLPPIEGWSWFDALTAFEKWEARP